MDFKALQKKYQQLLIENNRLKEEIKKLKAQSGLTAGREESQDSDTAVSGYLSALEPELFDQQAEPKLSIAAEGINKRSGPGEKVRLFMSLFRGRDDVYAKRWENENQTETKKKYEDCITLSEFGEIIIQRKLKAKKPRTAKWYKDCINAFTDQNDGKDLKLSEITVRFLKDFEAEHRSRGNVTNTISNYMRGVRAIYNAAINEDEYFPERNVFTRYRIPTSKRVKKKALSKERGQMILSFPLEMMDLQKCLKNIGMTSVP
jgi:hypothetical protein